MILINFKKILNYFIFSQVIQSWPSFIYIYIYIYILTLTFIQSHQYLTPCCIVSAWEIFVSLKFPKCSKTVPLLNSLLLCNLRSLRGFFYFWPFSLFLSLCWLSFSDGKATPAFLIRQQQLLRPSLTGPHVGPASKTVRCSPVWSLLRRPKLNMSRAPIVLNFWGALRHLFLITGTGSLTLTPIWTQRCFF